ncbi:17462_t:CDS:2 [Cetraspora pellucida]|uniref:17462_t:CDS:1 n=1 Tax=Cetraspora pellucida TaxID=1433469 RepID=A0ACA9NI47_9GLOM|nr:17462_t:CDS:2 [Cetraspora pellucida]
MPFAFQESKKATEETEEKLLDDFLKLHAELEHEKEAHEDTKELNRRQMTLMNGCFHQLESQIKRLKGDKDILIKQVAEQQEIINEHKQFEKSQKVKVTDLQVLLTTANQELVKREKTNDKISKKLEQQALKLAKERAKKKL